jgi:hypothetical protein
MNDFIMAYYKASAYADDRVIEACDNFFKSLAKNDNEEIITKQITEIYSAIRQDINPKAGRMKSVAFWKTHEIKS